MRLIRVYSCSFVANRLSLELVPQLDQIRFGGLGSCAGGDRRGGGAVELDHHVHGLGIFLERLEDAGDIDLALAERAVAAEVLAPDVILRCMWRRIGRKSFTTFAASAPPFCS